jgi:21S rRNA (uridine2791-2'-O)-methyltransferase
VIDLVFPFPQLMQGFAPGSWTQVAVSKTHPHGRVLGLDILPCPAPQGASSMQGNFLSKTTQNRIKTYLADPARGRPVTDNAMIGEEMGYIDMAERDHCTNDADDTEKGVVDVVLSDMSEPWPQTEGFWKNYLTEAYFRMMNVSGIRVKDHGDSMVHRSGVVDLGFMRRGYVVRDGSVEKSGDFGDQVLYRAGG